jgi:hypothetical protein
MAASDLTRRVWNGRSGVERVDPLPHTSSDRDDLPAQVNDHESERRHHRGDRRLPSSEVVDAGADRHYRQTERG